MNNSYTNYYDILMIRSEFASSRTTRVGNYSVCSNWCSYCSHSCRSINRIVSFIPKPIKVHALYILLLHACRNCVCCGSHGHFDVEDINQDILTSESPSGTLRTARSNSFSYQKVSCCSKHL